jgi:membrane protease subunit HflC
MNKLFSILVLIIIGLFVFFASIFTVDETQKGILLKLGEIEKTDQGETKVYGAGLHFKIPFIEDIKKYDTRYRTLKIASSRIVTSEQKDVMIDAFVVWKIDDLALFYKSHKGRVEKATKLLSQYAESAMRAKIGNETIRELINNERDAFRNAIMEEVVPQAKKIGLKVTDVRTKQIDLPDSVTESIYQRMRSDREQAASKIRAEGAEKAEKIKSNADAQTTIIKAKAREKARSIRAQGEGKAAKIKRQAYSRNSDFFQFLRSMQAYGQSFKDQNGVMILKPEGKFFEHFNPANSK